MKPNHRILTISFFIIILSFRLNSQVPWPGITVMQDCAHDALRPMAVGVYDMFVNKTFVVFSGPHGDPYVGEIDHNNNNAVRAVQVGEIDTFDAHDYPQIAQSVDGYLHVVYEDRYFSSDVASVIHYSQSQNPHSIDGWINHPLVERDSLGGEHYIRGEYPTVFCSRTGTVYIMYRKIMRRLIDYVDDYGYPYRHPQCIKAYWDTDINEYNWTNPTPLMTRWNKEDHLNEMYIGHWFQEPYRVGEPERWHVVWILSGGEIHDQYHKNIYHAYFCPETEEFFSMSGVNLGKTIEGGDENGGDDMLDYCLVLNTGAPSEDNYPNYINLVAVDTSGYPLINTCIQWTGDSWVQKATSAEMLSIGPSSLDWYNGSFYTQCKENVFRSDDYGVSWERLAYIDLPDKHPGRGRQTVPIVHPSNPEASLWTKELNANAEDCIISVGGPGSNGIAYKINLHVNRPSVGLNGTAIVTAFICNDGDGRVYGDDRPITLTLYGRGSLTGGNTVTTTDGMVSSVFNAGDSAEIVLVKAESPGLESAITPIWVGGAIIEEPGTGSSDGFTLGQNYPNPFSNYTIIPFSLEKTSMVTITLYDVMGRKIQEIANGDYTKGSHEVVYENNLIRPGIYFYTLKAGNKSKTRSMLIMGW